MAEVKTIKVNVDTTDAVKGVDNLTDSVKDLEKESKNVGENSFKGVSANAKKSGKGIKGLSANFKALGGAIKATGIGLLVTVLASLAEGLSQNERASKFFKTAVEAVSIVTQDFINFVIDNGSNVVKIFKDVFQNPTKAIKELGTAIKENLIERFNSFLDVLGFVGEAFVKLIDGDFKGALDSVKNAGKELIDVSTGVNNTFDKVVDGVSGAVESIKNYGDEITKTASKNIDLARSAEIASAKQSLLVEQFDRQAEKLRQIRDNDLISIDERIKANNELGEVLEKQQKAQLAEADAILASAQAQVNKNNNTENAVALLEAQANKAGVLASVEGFRSEQLTNENALIKEKNDLVNAGIESDALRAFNQKEFDVSRIEDETLRLEKEKELLNEEREIEAERLQLKIDSFALGTQARLDAENELKDRLQEIDQEIILNSEASKKTQADKDKKDKADDLKREKIVQDAKIGLAQNAFKLAGALAEEGSALAKGVQVAQTIISSIQGVQSAYTTAQASPITVGFPGYPIVQAGLAGAFGAISVQKILATPTKSSSAGSVGSSGGGGGSAPPPAFNLVGGSGVNQIQDSLQEEQAPIQAFVVGSQVTNQQELDNAQASSASLG